MKRFYQVVAVVLILCLSIGNIKVETKAATYYYGTKKIVLTKNELIKYRGKVCFAICEENCKKIPGLSCEYAAQAPCVRVKSQNHIVTVFANDRIAYVDGKKMAFSFLPKEKITKKRRMMVVPFEELMQMLSIRCKWNENKSVCTLTKKKVSYAGKKEYTQYPYKFSDYAKKEYKKNHQASYCTYKKMLKRSKDKTEGFQFMTLNQYREVNEKEFIGYFDNEIEIYCRINKKSKQKSVLYGKGKQLLAAAKKYRIDPLYFTCQTFVESAYGTSILAKGRKIGKKKYYNLYGIKAYDKNPLKYGFKYAKKKGWNTVQKALFGAAEYLAKGYIHSKYKQNTLYKIRFIPRKAIWHQYASDPYYADKIGKKFRDISVCYAETNQYVYNYPRFK